MKKQELSLLELEKRKFKRKGNWYFVAVVAFLISIYYIPIYGKLLWKQVVSYDIQRWDLFYIGSVVGMHTFAAIAFALMFYPLYKFKIPFFEKFRTNPDSKWPWQQKDWDSQKYKTIVNLLTAHFIYIPIFAFVDTKIGMVYRTDLESFPGVFEFACQIGFSILVEDCLFFWSHYALHHPYLYKLIHKKHHEYNNPYTLTAEYAHPVEYFFGNVIPVSMGFKILRGRAHIFTVIAWVWIRIYITAEGHSGYDFPFSPLRIFPMSGGAEFHDFHHSKNSGAFGSTFMFWDRLMKTDRDFCKFREDFYEKKMLKKKS